MDTDRISYDRIDDAYYAGHSPESVPASMQRRDRERQEQREIEECQQEEQYPPEQFPDEPEQTP